MSTNVQNIATDKGSVDGVNTTSEEISSSLAPTPPIDRDMPEWVSYWIAEHRRLSSSHTDASMTNDVVVWLADQLSARDKEIEKLRKGAKAFEHLSTANEAYRNSLNNELSEKDKEITKLKSQIAAMQSSADDPNSYCRCAGIPEPKCAYCLSMQPSAEKGDA